MAERRDVHPGRAEVQPVDEFLTELDQIIAEHQQDNRVYAAVGDGSLSEELLTRLCKEFYCLGVWYTAEFPMLIANAPDTDALWLESSAHYYHWFQNFADETGVLGDPSHVGLKLEWARQMNITEGELLAYDPMPESIGMVFTTLYFIRRSYEEGLAAFAFAGERIAGRSDYAKTLYEGMRNHYKIEVENFAVHATAEPQHGAKAEELMREMAVTAWIQRRMRRAVRLVARARGARVAAMNRWLDEPNARRA